MGQDLAKGLQTSSSCKHLLSLGQTLCEVKGLMKDMFCGCQQPLTDLHQLGESQCEWPHEQFLL